MQSLCLPSSDEGKEEETEFGKGRMIFGPVLSQLMGCSAGLHMRHKLFPLCQMNTHGISLRVQDQGAQFASPWHISVPYQSSSSG